MTNPRLINVLHVVDTLGMGGAETWLMEVLRLWSRNKIGRMDFLVTSGQPGLFDEEARQLGAEVFYVRYARDCLPSFRREFRRVLRDGRYGAVHDHADYASGWHFWLGGVALPRVRVTHVHNPSYQIRHNYGVTLRRRLTARIGLSLVARHSTHIAGTSRQVITEYGFDAPKFRNIPKAALHCGFNPDRFVGDAGALKASVCDEFGWPGNSRVILFAGRIDESPDPGHPRNHKNSGFAVSVGIECARRDRAIHLILAGARSAAVPVLEQRIAAAGLSGRIKFVGIRTDIERLMMACDALLFPSRGEGLGMVAVEAQAAGLPVLASSAVPQEAVVVPELVRFQRLDAGEAQWSVDLLQLAAGPRPVRDANRRVAASPFAIEHSARALAQLYSQGSLS